MQAVYKDACVKCVTKVSLRDLHTIRSRTVDEGMSFLTITLPSFSRDFENCLEKGYVGPQDFLNFKKSGAIPAFLQGLLGRIFSRETGRINDFEDNSLSFNSPIHHASFVDSIRQICLAFKKIKLACTPAREKRALESFVENERSFNVFPLPERDDELFKSVSFVLWSGLVHHIDVLDLIPKHGPGQTAERISGNQKYNWRFWHTRLEPYFPFIDSSYSASCAEPEGQTKELEIVSFVHQNDEQPSRVVTVPKTLKNPRVIAIEPCCMQYAQQAVSSKLVSLLERYSFTAGHVNFSDQTINGSLALQSSNDGRLATIDLSEASDRVPVGYALEMFRSNPDLKDAIEACRSSKAALPSGEVLPLRKFASMGSALCFPIEAMYFYTICVVALLEFHNLPVSRRNIFTVSRDVYVYGDDIIVPTDTVATVLDHLRKYNCKVNVHKTFFRGYFRESCGVDAYRGRVVTPTYINRTRPKNRQQAKEIISCVSTANLFLKKGYVNTSNLLFKRAENVLGKLPGITENSPLLGRISSWSFDPPKRWNKRFQRMEILCWIQKSVHRTDVIDGYAALQKSLFKLEGLRNLLLVRDRFHLERSALHGEVAIQRRWVPASLMSGYRQ